MRGQWHGAAVTSSAPPATDPVRINYARAAEVFEALERRSHRTARASTDRRPPASYLCRHGLLLTDRGLAARIAEHSYGRHHRCEMRGSPGIPARPKGRAPRRYRRGPEHGDHGEPRGKQPGYRRALCGSLRAPRRSMEDCGAAHDLGIRTLEPDGRAVADTRHVQSRHPGPQRSQLRALKKFTWRIYAIISSRPPSSSSRLTRPCSVGYVLTMSDLSSSSGTLGWRICATVARRRGRRHICHGAAALRRRTALPDRTTRDLAASIAQPALPILAAAAIAPCCHRTGIFRIPLPRRHGDHRSASRL
jgi:hypothetical protein